MFLVIYGPKPVNPMDEIVPGKDADKFIGKNIGVETDDPAFNWTRSMTAATILLNYFSDKHAMLWKNELAVDGIVTCTLTKRLKSSTSAEARYVTFIGEAHNPALAVCRAACAAFEAGYRGA